MDAFRTLLLETIVDNPVAVASVVPQVAPAAASAPVVPGRPRSEGFPLATLAALTLSVGLGMVAAQMG